MSFPVHYVEVKNHDHNYYAVSDRVNTDAWAFCGNTLLQGVEAWRLLAARSQSTGASQRVWLDLHDLIAGVEGRAF